jgi:hypothetical protein
MRPRKRHNESQGEFTRRKLAWRETRCNRKNYTMIDGKHGWIVQQVVDACVIVLGISEVDIRAVGEVHSADKYEVICWNRMRYIVSGREVVEYADTAYNTATMRRRPQAYDSLTQATMW